MRWILDNVPEARAIGDALAFGTIESWLIWKLTGGAHLTDASNASRTQLMALEGRDWDDELCALMEVPRAHLPEIVDMAGEVGRCDPALLGAAIPICGLAGGQQSATIGQGCRTEEQTAELPSLMRCSIDVFCLKTTTNLIYRHL